jgi:hypothetical protein
MHDTGGAMRHRKIVIAKDGIVRFRKNNIVADMLEVSQRHGFGLNEIAVCSRFTREERAELAQLIGYSVDGYCDLSYALGKRKACRIAARRAR